MNDFRMPNIFELRSLLWLSEKEEVLFRAVFNDANGWFWSSSPYADYSHYAWNVYFGNGGVSGGYKGYDGRVRLVRAGQCFGGWRCGDDPKLRYHPSECGEYITDGLTGLEWRRDKEPGFYIWDQAVEKFGVGAKKRGDL
jgi:hypothetical protein